MPDLRTQKMRIYRDAIYVNTKFELLVVFKARFKLGSFDVKWRQSL